MQSIGKGKYPHHFHQHLRNTSQKSSHTHQYYTLIAIIKQLNNVIALVKSQFYDTLLDKCYCEINLPHIALQTCN